MVHLNKIMISGGHISPALAFIDRLKQIHPKCTVVFVGRRYNNEREHSVSFEYKEITKRDIRFIPLDAGRVTRILSLHSILNMIRIPIGLFQSFLIVQKEKPDIILSFGGYLGLPIACAGYILKIQVFTHEQTISPGIANKLISYFAKKVFISFEQSKFYFPKHNIILTGNPVRKSIFETRSSEIKINSSLKCVYITGGSLGSHTINILVEKIIKELLKKYMIIHQTGNILEYGDYNRLQQLRNTLPKELRDRYLLKTHINDNDIGYVYSNSHLVISRSGANTWFELVILRKPAILIPLPWSSYDEQRKQASLLASYGAAEIFEQTDNASRLLDLINKMIDNKEVYEKAYQNISGIYTSDATDRIIQEIFSEK